MIYARCTKILLLLLLIGLIVLLHFTLSFPAYRSNALVKWSSESSVTNSLTLWASNLHHGCRVDTATLLQGLKQNVIIADHFQRNNYYRTALTRPGILFPTDKRQLAPFMYSHVTHSDSLSENDIRSFYDYYRNDSLMLSVNAFYCSFPSSMCEIYYASQ